MFLSYYNNIFRLLNNKIIRHPIIFASTFACIKNSIADNIIQNSQNKKELDIRRNVSFSLFGLLHVGAGQYIILNKIIPYFIPCLKLLKPNNNSVLKAMLLDQFIHVPFIYFPFFYIFKEIGETKKPNIDNIINNYKSNIKNDFLISALIFMPLQYINFKYIPTYYRVPILSSCGFLYSMLISYLRL